MTSILSFLLSLTLFFSGGMAAENPADYASSSLTISDVSMTYFGKTYTLNPSARVGIATQEDTALLDFSLPMGEDAFFPTQVKWDKQSVSMLAGNSDTVYTFLPEYWASESRVTITAEGEQMIEAAGDLLKSVADMTTQWYMPTPADYIEYLNKVMDIGTLAKPITTTDSTLLVDGKTVPAVCNRYVLDHEAFIALLEKAFDLSGQGDLYRAYMKWLVMLTQYATADQGSAVASLGDFMALLDVSFELTVEETTAGDMARVYELELSRRTGETDEVDMLIPIRITIMDGQTTVKVDYKANDTAIIWSCEGNSDVLHMDYTIGDQSMNVSCKVDVTSTENGLETICESEIMGNQTENMNYRYHVRTGDSPLVEMELAIHDEANTTVQLTRHTERGKYQWYASLLQEKQELAAVTVDGTEGEEKWNVTLDLPMLKDIGGFGLSFQVAIDHLPIEDRMFGKKERAIDNAEQENQSVGLYLAGRQYRVDSYRLWHEVSVNELIEALGGTELASGSFALDNNRSWTFENGKLPDALPLPWPKLNWLPEGYQLETTQVDVTDIYTRIQWVYTSGDKQQDDQASFTLTINDYLYTSTKPYYLDAQGRIAACEDQILWIVPNGKGDNGWSEITYDLDGYSLQFSNPQNSLTLDEAGKIITNLSLEDMAQ